MDNFFSGDKICDWIGQCGFGATMTCRRDRLPSGVDGKYFHKEKTDSSICSKVSKFLQPVIAVKKLCPLLLLTHIKKFMSHFNLLFHTTFHV